MKTKYYTQAKGRPPTSLKCPQWYSVARQPPSTASSVYISPGAQWGCGKGGWRKAPIAPIDPPVQDPSPGKEDPEVPTPSKKENVLSILSSGTKGTSNPAGHSWSQRGPRSQQNNGKQCSWMAFFFLISPLLSCELRTPKVIRASLYSLLFKVVPACRLVFCSSRTS